MNYVPPLKARDTIRLTGAVYTPAGVAAALVANVSGIVRAARPQILEPSIGDGAFIGPLAQHFPLGILTGIDLDAEVVAALSAAMPYPIDSRFQAADYITFVCDRIVSEDAPYDLVVGNPPFIRKHNFSDDFKEAVARLATITGYPLAGLKNSWAAFLVASTHLLRDDGVAAFVVPYELMTVAYGHQLLSWLAERFGRIDLFISDQKAFPEIDQDAIIFVGQRRPMTPAGLFIQRVSAMEHLNERIEYAIDAETGETLALALNRFLIPPQALPLVQRLRRECARISDHCSSAPGIVTAANEFFILTEARAKELELLQFTLPVLKKGSFASRLPIFSKRDFSVIANREPCRFLRVEGNRDELPASIKSYLATGEERAFDQRYKCRNRKNWYEVPLVPRADGFVFKRSHEYPRVCLNEAEVYITDTAYGLKMRAEYSMRGLCFSFYNSLTLLFAEIDGRFYGGGVLELSPNEFRGLPLVYHEPSESEFENFLAAHADPNGITSILDFGDRWLGKKLSLSVEELRFLREAWSSVRSHRLRHGKAANHSE
ncbi:Eco57I restriction-modification methylase domain-containing protein [Rhizobium sp. LEGMi135b]